MENASHLYLRGAGYASPTQNQTIDYVDPCRHTKHIFNKQLKPTAETAAMFGMAIGGFFGSIAGAIICAPPFDEFATGAIICSIPSDGSELAKLATGFLSGAILGGGVFAIGGILMSLVAVGYELEAVEMFGCSDLG